MAIGTLCLQFFLKDRELPQLLPVLVLLLLGTRQLWCILRESKLISTTRAVFTPIAFPNSHTQVSAGHSHSGQPKSRTGLFASDESSYCPLWYSLTVPCASVCSTHRVSDHLNSSLTALEDSRKGRWSPNREFPTRSWMRFSWTEGPEAYHDPWESQLTRPEAFLLHQLWQMVPH